MRFIALTTLFLTFFLLLKSQFVEKKLFINNYYHPLLDKYDVLFYFIDLEATNQNKYIKGKTTIKVKVVSNTLDTLLLQLHNSLTIDSIKFYNYSCLFQHTSLNEVFIKLPETLGYNDTFSVVVYYKGTSAGDGIRNGQAYSKKVTWTLTEPYGALDWFPCKQIVTDKADSAYIYITCENILKAGSNGILVKVDTIDQNKVRYCWQTRYPIAYYLISLTISDYIEYSFYAFPENLSQDSIFIVNYIYNNNFYFNYVKPKVDSTKQCMELLCKLYGLYPFYTEKYGHITAPIGGGMEHQTLTTLSGFNLELIIHEMGHQWFGDYVTCATWQDIWVNEGFATYTYYLGMENFYTTQACQNWLEEIFNWIMNESGGSVYVPFSDLNNVARIFDYRLTYLKGASLVHMMRYIIDNDSLFFSILKGFLSQYAFSNATGDDFKNYLNSYTNYNFDNFFNEWYYGEGYPTFSLYWAKSNDTVYFALYQQSSMPTVTAFFHIPIEIKFSGINNDTTIRVNHEYNGQIFSVVLPFDFIEIKIDPENNIVNKVGEITQNVNLNNLNNLFCIYPNPCDNYLFISGKDEKLNESFINIYDITGKRLKSVKYSQRLNIENLSHGFYIIEINNCKKRFIKR